MMNKPDWMAKLDQVEEALTAALTSAGVGAEASFLIGMRWSSFRYALFANNKEEVSMRMVQICKRLDDAGLPAEPWAYTSRPARTRLTDTAIGGLWKRSNDGG